MLMRLLPAGAQEDASANLPAGSADYYARLKKPATWPAFPLRIQFVHNDDWTLARQSAALRGFGWWATATNGYVRYRLVEQNDHDTPQVTVRFSPEEDGGHTLTTWRINAHSQSLFRADMTLGFHLGRLYDVTCVAAHEFGHALGINAHSPNRRDLMYPVHTIGNAERITTRDRNTLLHLYPQAAGSSTHAGTGE